MPPYAPPPLSRSTIQARKVPRGATHRQQRRQQQEGTGNLRAGAGHPASAHDRVRGRAGRRGGLSWRQRQEGRLPLWQLCAQGDGSNCVCCENHASGAHHPHKGRLYKEGGKAMLWRHVPTVSNTAPAPAPPRAPSKVPEHSVKNGGTISAESLKVSLLFPPGVCFRAGHLHWGRSYSTPPRKKKILVERGGSCHKSLFEPETTVSMTWMTWPTIYFDGPNSNKLKSSYFTQTPRNILLTSFPFRPVKTRWMLKGYLMIGRNYS